jgi:cold shock CspA family protein
MRYGVVISFNSTKGIGNIKDNTTHEEYAFSKEDCPHEVEILDEVAFEPVTENNKKTATKVKPSY